MATPNQSPAPQQQPQQGQVLSPVPAQAPVPASISQFTAISAYVPPQVWTEQALLDFHAKQKDVILDNNQRVENDRKRQYKQNWAGIIMVGGIIGFGCYLTAIGNPFGKDIIGATILFLAGFMAGKGAAKD